MPKLESNYNTLKIFLDGFEPYHDAGFTLKDDKWNLEHRRTIAAKPSHFILRFSAISDWLKPFVKAYLAWSWLAQDLSLSSCQARLSHLRQLSNYLSRFREEIYNLNQLDQSVTEGFFIYLSEELNPRRVYQIMKGLSQFANWIRSEYKMGLEFRPELVVRRPPKKRENSSKTAERVIPTIVVEQLMSAISVRQSELYPKWINSSLNRTHIGKELLYLQALKILLYTPLRISQILLLSRNPLRESVGDEAPGVWLEFFESKTHQGLLEEYVPQAGAQIVRDAVKVAIEITNDIANESKLVLGQEDGHPKQRLLQYCIQLHAACC